MSTAYFQVKLALEKLGGAAARLVAPEAIRDLRYQFVRIKEGGGEGIVAIEESDATLKSIAKDTDCKKLTAKQLEELQAKYPTPKLKQLYRRRPVQSAAAQSSIDDNFEVDAKGHRIVDTFQTVRSGFYLIDVPVIPGPL